MSINYKQATNGYIEAQHPRFSKSEYGLDIAQVVMSGISTDLRSYLLSLRQGMRLATYATMFLSTWDNDHHRSFPPVTLTYKGLLNGALPNPIVSDDITTSTTSATAGDSGDAADQRTWEIVFSSPARRFRYVASTRPSGPKFQTWVGGPVKSPSIITQSIRDGNGRPRASAPGIGQIFGAQLAGFTVDPVPGTPYFECEEIWQGVIVLQ